MLINNTPIFAEVSDIVEELRRQLGQNNIQLLGDVRDTPYNLTLSY